MRSRKMADTNTPPSGALICATDAQKLADTETIETARKKKRKNHVSHLSLSQVQVEYDVMMNMQNTLFS